MRSDCQAAETRLSYLRRVVQARHDIVAAELERRSSGGAPGDLSALMDRLPDILSDRTRATGPGRLPQTMEPGDVSGRLADELDSIVGGVKLDEPDQLPEAELSTISERLEALEADVSGLRRQLFARIDALAAELTRRYKSGEASIDS